MTSKTSKNGGFTLPGEAGFEDLTLDLAKRWGADAIRDSDGTVLSDKITGAGGFDIYSTICLVRCDNEWAKAHLDKLQQNYLMSYPVIAESDTVRVNLLDGFFREQFRVNANDNPKEWWQVFDRTTGEEVPADRWSFDPAKGIVTITRTTPCHRYTVNFLAYRIWEAISMYNHITNNWGDREHQMVIDPIYPETQEFMLQWLKGWLDEHPRTKIVRFTSMFYNFAWFWGNSPELRFVYADWGSHEMMASPAAMRLFAKAKGYKLTSEDFVNKGAYCSTHNVPSPRLLDWMDFINQFVVSFGRKCIDLVHAAGKEAYMFYDDHWVGTEPWGHRFKDFNFDGLIKCVFNAFEARLCAGVQGVKTKELRLHPYLFPTGLRGEPTFMEGGDPASDARRFWSNIRRGLMRQPVDRIGLGGYLHLVQGYPDFLDAIDNINDEFRQIKKLHAGGTPYTAPLKVAVLTAWGKPRSWVYVGHFIHGMELYEVTESLAGLPIEVVFISFDDILRNGVPKDAQVLLNAGKVNTAWTGGDHWKNPKIIEAISTWVANGGSLLGVGEPSAAAFSGQYFQLAHILGVDRDTSPTFGLCKRKYTKSPAGHFILQDATGDVDFGTDIDNVFVTDKTTQVLADRNDSPQIAVHNFGKGRTVYLSGFKFAPANTRLLHRSLFWAAARESDFQPWTCTNVNTDCAYYPASKKLVVVNSSPKQQTTEIFTPTGEKLKLQLKAYGLRITNA
jgi:beta-D-galactosyl-(1->4)-L-rhamnose phosphorylase